ncbi:MAG: DUF5686 family protein [Flavobacteriales bacterium]
MLSYDHMTAPLKSFWVLFMLLLFWAQALNAQKTKVYGKVTNAETGEPVGYVNVAFKDSKFGTTTDTLGEYSIETYYATDTLIFSAVGYEKEKVAIEKDVEQRIDIELKKKSYGTKTVEVKPDEDRENPALKILRRIIRYKDVNDREKLKAFEYEVYNKVEFDLNNISKKMQERKIFKPFSFVFDNIDSSGGKPYLPIFMTESLSRYYFRRDPEEKKEVIKASKVSGVKNKSVSQFLGDMYQNVNIYDNYINIFEKNFVSPIADFGKGFYKYYLLDSVKIDGHRCFKIRFMPRRKQELTFDGTMWVDDTTYAIKRVKARIADEANINFVDSLEVTQDYQQVKKEVWMLKKDQLLIDFNVSDKAWGFYGRKTTSYEDFKINKPEKPEFYRGMEDVIVKDSANDRSDSYWKENRHMPLSEDEKRIYSMVDTMKTLPQFKSWVDVISLIVEGYYDWNGLDFGPYFNTYSWNPVEGHRFRLGIKTNPRFNKRLELGGYAAYGLKDQRFKYGGHVRYFLSKKPRQKVRASYSYDVEQLGQSPNAFREDNILSSFLRRNPATKLTMVEEWKASFEHEWFRGFSSRIIYKDRRIEPLGDLTREPLNGKWSNGMEELHARSLGIYTRFAYNEKFVSDDFNRVSLGTDYPVLEAQYTRADDGILHTDHEFQKLEVRVDHQFPLGYLGNMRYRIEGGKVFGTLPYPLLKVHEGNVTYFYDKAAYNMMDLFEFVSDRYVGLSVTHHLEGFFLNRIPLFRRLKFREVVTFKGVVGDLRDEHRQVMPLLEGMKTLKKPYMEVGVGVENIFKIFRIDGVWRLTHINEGRSRFGLRGTMQIRF